MIYSDEQMTEELEVLKEYLTDLDFPAEIIPKGNIFPMPSLLIGLPVGMESEDRFMVCSFIPLDQEEAECTKFLQLYVEYSAEKIGLPELTLLKAINQINNHIAIGHFAYREKTEVEEAKVHFRYSCASEADLPVNEEVFCECLFLSIYAMDFFEIFVKLLQDGLTLEEAFERVEEMGQEVLEEREQDL